MTMPSSEVALVDNTPEGDDMSRGGGDGDDRHDAELLLPGDVPPQLNPEKNKTFKLGTRSRLGSSIGTLCLTVLRAQEMEK